ncbi:MAG TPA: hypothetical protein VEL47_02205, partial [Myxococcota bacterium]|nr:hypothetical protein [Myxococcota bacterium]
MSRTQLAAIFAASALAYLLSLNVYAKDAILCVPPPMPDNSGDVDALIMCINKANALGGGTIELSGLTYTLPSATFGLFTADGLNGLPDITSNITLKNGVITKDPSLEFRHLHISPPGSLSLKKITLENGNISGLGGGAIFVAAGAILGTVEYSSFINNMAVFTSAVVIPPGGGAIRVDGEFYLIKHSIFSSNQAFVSTGSGFIAGGAILLTRVGPANGGMIIDSIFVANAANGLSFDDANGGAIYLDNSTSLDSIIRSSFLGNSANHGGGAISVVSANLSTVDSSTFSFNTSQTTGAIDAGGSIGTISNSTFDHNLVASTFTVPIGGAIIIEDGAS